jgi:hypothetical protein
MKVRKQRYTYERHGMSMLTAHTHHAPAVKRGLIVEVPSVTTGLNSIQYYLESTGV